MPGVLGTGNGGDGGELAFIPNAFYKMDISPQLRFGFAVNVPFGLSTDYAPGWQGPTVALESAIKTINLNPSLGYKVSDTLSIGGGVSVQKIDAKLSRFTGAGASGNVTLAADDIGSSPQRQRERQTQGARLDLAERVQHHGRSRRSDG